VRRKVGATGAQRAVGRRLLLSDPLPGSVARMQVLHAKGWLAARSHRFGGFGEDSPVSERFAGFGEDSGQLHDRFSLRSFWIDTRGDTRRTKDTAEVRGDTESTDVDVASPCFG